MSQKFRNIRIGHLPAIRLLAWVVGLGVVWNTGTLTSTAFAQSSFFQVPPANPNPPVYPTQFQTPPAAVPPNAYGVPSGTLAPPLSAYPPSTTLQLTPPPQGPTFDPFATQVPPAQFGAPMLDPNPYGTALPPPVYNPGVGMPPLGPGAESGTWWPNSSSAWPNIAWSRYAADYMPRLFSAPRARYTWISGNHDNQLGLNALELNLSLAWKSCLCGGDQPIRVTPGFVFNWWSGPDTAVTGYDMPSKTYDFFLAMDYVSNQSQQRGIEASAAVGAYFDSNSFTSDALRITGVGLGWCKLNPYTTAKIGVEYYDRVAIKLLPAFGVFMAPNSELKIDLYFPRPKVAHRVTGVPNQDTWVYAGAELGGGSWVIERLAGFSDQVDVNEIRVFLGSETRGPRGGTGFLEFGYVFDREMVYRSTSNTSLGLEDAFMLRMGLAF